ncbi:MAG: hypothetical protein IJL02_05360 [Methanobrevibacter sp.]|uniref:hypothetical protein n=1 Tax=Methanobrevibacter sp. TaxID=66852 RepID=UPI0025D63C98|nr:hypothetical protein [Methanobrevibacter sp.]MBQ6099274.1 hypothetical protein [Methanobrevibacter sp.]
MGFLDKLFGKKETTSNVKKQTNDKGILPLREKQHLLQTSSPVCDVCNKPLNIDKSFFVPNSVFYSSKEYRLWYRDHTMLLGPDYEARLRMMEMNDPTEGSAVCEDCIRMFR